MVRKKDNVPKNTSLFSTLLSIENSTVILGVQWGYEKKKETTLSFCNLLPSSSEENVALIQPS